jgi:phosphoesterase RecJ-like protein
MDLTLSKRFEQLISLAGRVLLVTHVAPDGDAIGSLLGLGRLLRAQGKEVGLACEDRVPPVYAWLPGSKEIVRKGTGTYDLLISLDCSDARRMGSVFKDRLATIPLLNIDHHVTNTLFGTVNWVDPSNVATAQLVLTLADSLGWPVDQDVAICLLTGLVTDTRSFRTHNVDTEAMRATLRLMEAGASLSEISQRVLDQRPLASIRLWGQAITQMHLEGDVLWTEVTRDMRQRWALEENGDSGLANFLSGVREPKVVVVFTERDNGTIDVGMRSVPGYDVSQVALELGGGGHPQAAGCTLEGDLNTVKERVLEQIKRGLDGQVAGAA